MTDLTVETRRIDPVPSLIPYADGTRPLLFLRRGDGIAGLGEALRLEPATLSPLLKRLEVAGLLTRRRNADDERALDVSLTPAGTALRAKAEKVPGLIVERLGMDLSELERIRDGLTRLLAASSA